MDTALREKATVELGRFFQLAAEHVPDLTMPSALIDKVWHEMLEDREAYDLFSRSVAGMFVGHSEMSGEGEISWVSTYEARFGKLDSVWFTDGSGSVNWESWNRYLQDGTFRCSWDCGPIIDPDEHVDPTE